MKIVKIASYGGTINTKQISLSLSLLDNIVWKKLLASTKKFFPILYIKYTLHKLISFRKL